MSTEQILQTSESGGVRIVRRWRPHRAPWPELTPRSNDLAICLVEQGQQLVMVDGMRQAVGAGQYVLLPPGCVHSSATEKNPCTETMIHIPARHLTAAAAALALGAGDSPVPAGVFRTPPELDSLVRILLSYPDGVGRDPTPATLPAVLTETLVGHLCVWIIHHHRSPGAARPATAPRSPIDAVHAAEARMRARLDLPHQLKDLARTAGLSRFHFLRLFKRNFGAPPHAHLLRLRVQTAGRLLATTRLSATAIAFEVGFTSASGLSAAFKKAHGESPDRWRNRPATRNASNDTNVVAFEPATVTAEAGEPMAMAAQR